MSIQSVSHEGVNISGGVAVRMGSPGQGVYMVRALVGTQARSIAAGGVYQIDVRTEWDDILGLALQERPVIPAGELALCHNTLFFYLGTNEHVTINLTGLAGDTNVDYTLQLIPLTMFMGTMEATVTPGISPDDVSGSTGRP